MKCEYCDSIIKDVPDNGVCPNCGGSLNTEGVQRSTKLRFPDPPIGLYVDAGGDYIEVGEDSVELFKKVPLGKGISRNISFDEILGVKFEVGSYFKMGFLCVRERKDISIPIPTSYMQAIRDETTIVLTSTNNERFYPVYAFLKECANTVNGEKNG